MTDWEVVLKQKKKKRSGDNFAREKKEGLHGWFSRRGGKEGKGKENSVVGIDCSSCGKKMVVPSMWSKGCI